MYRIKHIRLIGSLVLFVMILASVFFAIAEHGNWDCPDCGRKDNTGNYCGTCAYPAPWMAITPETDQPAAETTAAPATVDRIPALSSLYPGKKTHLIVRKERWYSQYGPGNDYAKTSDGYKTDSKHSNTITVFYCEGDWAFADIVYSTASEKYAYLPLRAVADSDQMPQISEPDCFEGVTKTAVIPSWGPGDTFVQDRGCEIAANTVVKAFFTENDYVYSEFSCEKGKVRLWLPLSEISFE